MSLLLEFLWSIYLTTDLIQVIYCRFKDLKADFYGFLAFFCPTSTYIPVR